MELHQVTVKPQFKVALIQHQLTGRIVKGSGNTSNAPEVGDTMLSGIPNGGGNIISTGTLYLPTNLSSFGPPPGGLAQNKVIQTDTNGVITSVYQCT